jgi:hypothetical protein
MHARISLERLFAAAQWGVLSFLALSFAAMPLYPGGTFRDRSSVGYRFFSNFLSDLGMPTSWSGAANPLGAFLFVSGEALLAIGLVAFFVGFVRLLASVPRARAWSRAAAVTGTVIALALVTAGLTPANRFEWLHLEAAKLAFRAACAATALLAVAVIRDRRFSTPTNVTSITLPLLLAVYVAILEWGPSLRASDYGLTFQATAQKLIVLAVLPCVFFLARQASARRVSAAIAV